MVCGVPKTVGSNPITLPAVFVLALAWSMAQSKSPEGFPSRRRCRWPRCARVDRVVRGFPASRRRSSRPSGARSRATASLAREFSRAARRPGG